MDSIISPVSMKTWAQSPVDFADELGKWFETYGFAVVADHGVDQDIIDNVLEKSKAFFALPEEIKTQYKATLGGARGYVSFGVETAVGHDKADLKEFWHQGRNLPKGHKYEQYMAPNILVDTVNGFNEAIDTFYTAFDDLGKKILKSVAIYLKLEHDFFADKVDMGNSVLRLLHYPPVTGEIEPGAIRAGAHGDINVITLLLGADEPGLQLLDKQGKWQNVTAPKGCLAINVGDMLSRLTNGVLPSSIHRVINPEPERAKFARYSTPFFLHFNPDYLIETLPSCGESKFEPITAQEFLEQRLSEIKLM
jgi:isopenicillin N synthase-like dioxygenase